MLSKKARIVGLMLAGVVALNLFSGCGSSGKSSSTGGKNTITISLHQDPPKLDPMLSSAFVDRIVFQSLYDKLVDLDSKGNIVPMLAEKWEISPDGLVYTFHLKKGVKFHDGTEFNADAVKFNLERDKQKSSNRKGELSAVKEIKVVDPLTVQLILSKPYAPLLSQLTDRAGMMVSPTAAKKLGDKFQTAPVGTGPYKFESRSKGNQLVLVKNKDYWKADTPKSDKIVFKIMTDANVALVNLKSGQVDMTNRFPLNEAGKYANDSKISVINQPGPGFKGLMLNMKDPAFQDKRVRQALEKAIDREAIVKVALFGVGTPGRTALSPTSWAYDAALDKPQPADVEEAKKLLAAAGKADGLSFTIQTDSDPISQQVCQLLQKQFKAINVDMKIQKQDFGTLLDRTDKGDYQMAYMGWSGRTDPDGNFYSWVYSKGTDNFMGYADPTMDQLLEEGRTVTDQGTRKGIYQKIMVQLLDDVPYIYLYHENNVFGLSKAVQGFTPVPDGMIRTADMKKN